MDDNKFYQYVIDLKDYMTLMRDDMMQIKDNMVGINEEKLKYQWTQSEETPSQESFTQNFANEQTITKDTGDGNWYLWIYAEDKVGNVTITRSNAFNFDNTPPVTNVFIFTSPAL